MTENIDKKSALIQQRARYSGRKEDDAIKISENIKAAKAFLLQTRVGKPSRSPTPLFLTLKSTINLLP